MSSLSRSGRARAVVIISLCVILVAGAVGAALKIFHDIDEVIRDAYVQWSVADVIITYLDMNDGQWPRGWDDLEEPYEIKGRPWTFEELRKRVDIDFTANPEELTAAELKDGKPPFKVVFLRNGAEGHNWEGADPNTLIWEHLQKIADGTAPKLKRPVPEERAARQAVLDAGGRWELDDDGHVGLVNLGFTNITDAAMEQIRDLTQLRSILLYGTKVTDAGLVHLENMQEMDNLTLASKNFTDGAFPHITRIPNLRVLNMNRARITDKGIEQLHQMTGLKEVMLAETSVTKEGVQRLRQALPQCEVYFPDSN